MLNPDSISLLNPFLLPVESNVSLYNGCTGIDVFLSVAEQLVQYLECPEEGSDVCEE